MIFEWAIIILVIIFASTSLIYLSLKDNEVKELKKKLFYQTDRSDYFKLEYEYYYNKFIQKDIINEMNLLEVSEK